MDNCMVKAMMKLASLLVVLQVLVSVEGANQSMLLDALFPNYQKSVRPICGADQAIPVYVGMAVRQIIELDEPKQILYLNAWLRLRWFDCQLQWDPNDYDNISQLILPYDMMWTPDITLYDNAVGEMPGLKDYRIALASDGTVTYNFPTVISVLCKMDVSYFPFDTQKCPLKFGSWSHHGLELDVTNRSTAGDISSFVPNSEFDITEMPLERNVFYYGCCPEPYPDVTFYVYMKRKPMFYVLNLLFPCILITSVSLLGFILPPEAGEKVSLEITVLLSLAVFLLVVSETLPPTSETIPYIGVYFVCAMMLVSLSTILTVVVLNMHHKEYKPVPHWMRVVFLHYGAKIVFVKDDYTASRPLKVHVQEQNSLPMKVDHHNKMTTMHNGFMGGHKENGHANGPQEKGEYLHDSRPISALGSTLGEVGGEFNLVEPSGPFAPLVTILNEQLRLMRKWESRKEGKQRHDAQTNEWRRVALVLDRLFLLGFTLLTFITSLVILVPVSQSG